MARPLQRPRPARGHHLAQLRRAANLSQTALAELIAEPQSSLAKWELSSRPPPSDVLPKLAKALDVTVEDILNIKADAPAKKRGPPSRGHRLIDQVEQLPPRYQEKIYDVLSALLNQYGRAA